MARQTFIMAKASCHMWFGGNKLKTIQVRSIDCTTTIMRCLVISILWV